MKKKSIALILSVLLIAALLGGCGSKNASSDSRYAVAEEAAYDYAPSSSSQGYGLYKNSYAAAEAYEYYDEAPAAMAVPMPEAAGDAAADISASRENGAKLIYTADLDMETLDFDAAVAALTKLTAAVGGYFEASSVSDQGAWRWASYTVRVPSANYRAFLDQAGDGCHVLSQQEYTEDVSEYYYDTAGRLETQKTKLARLQQLLLQAEDMEDIITIEDAISETEEQIDRLSGTLRRYDALVDYSTVTVYLEEVKVYEPEPDPTFGTRLGLAFASGAQSFSRGVQDILVALAYGWLWLLLLAAVVGFQFWLTDAVHKSLEAAAFWRGNIIGDVIGGLILLLITHHFVKKPKDDEYHG